MWPLPKKFHYQNGPVQTSTPWRRPSFANYEAWRDAFLRLPGIEDYEVWLCGGFLQQKWPTWDVDIVLTGPIEPYTLEKILTLGQQLALDNYRLLVDLQHQSVPPLAPLSLQEKTLITRTVLSPKIIKNGETLTDWTREPSLRQLGPHLWQVTNTAPDPAQVARMQAGISYEIAPKRIYPVS